MNERTVYVLSKRFDINDDDVIGNREMSLLLLLLYQFAVTS